MQQSHSLAGVHQLLLSHFAASLCLLQTHSQLLNLSHHQTVSTFHHSSLFLHVFCSPDGIIQVQLGILETAQSVEKNEKMLLCTVFLKPFSTASAVLFVLEGVLFCVRMIS